MCESIERAVAQRGSDYAVRFECVGGGNVMTLDKNLPFAENLCIIRRIPSGCRGTKHPLFYQTRPSQQRLLWLWMELARCAIPHIPAEIPPLFTSTFLNHRALASGKKKKVHNFCCCYVVLSRTANRSPSADYLCDKHMPAHWFSAFECRCLDSRLARARARTKGRNQLMQQLTLKAQLHAENPEFLQDVHWQMKMSYFCGH